MGAPRDPSERKRNPIITRWDLWLGGAGFCIVMVCAILVMYARQIFGWFELHAPLTLVALVVCYVAFTNRRFLRFRWISLRALRTLGDRVGVGEPKQLRSPQVIDGDTIDDDCTNIRYRLANIDAPETGDNAKCFRERCVGELAKSAAIALVASAKVVSVRRTWRFDQYGRAIAYVLLDGVDLGELLVKRGLARRWRGRRERWCGAGGPLVKLAELRGEKLSCATCANWRKPNWR